MAVEATETAPEAEAQITDETPVVEQAPAEETAVETSGGVDEAVETSGLDDELTSLATAFGIDVSTVADPREVPKAMARQFSRQMVEFGRSLRQKSDGGPPASPTTTAKQPAADPSDLDFDKLVPDLTEGEVHPELIAWAKQAREALKTHHKHLSQRLDERTAKLSDFDRFQQRIEQIEQFTKAQSAQQEERELDSIFAGLGTEWEGLFGKDPQRQIASTPQGLNRNKVVDAVNAIYDAHAAQGRQPPQMAQAVKWAIQAEFGDQINTITRQKLLKEAEAKKKATAAATAQKRTVPQSDRAKAAQAFREAARQLGMPVTG